MTNYSSPPTLCSMGATHHTPASSMSPGSTLLCASASTSVVSTPTATSERGCAALSIPSSEAIFDFSPSLDQQIAAHRATVCGSLATARTRTASQRLQEALARPSGSPERLAGHIPHTPLAPSLVSFDCVTPPRSPTVPQPPSSGLIFAFSPSLGQQIAAAQAQAMAPLMPQALVSGQRLQRMMATAPSHVRAEPLRPPLRGLASASSFDSELAQTASSMDSVRLSLRSDVSDTPLRSPSPENFAIHRWLDNDSATPCRRPSTPMPPLESTRDAHGSDSDSDSDSDLTQGPSEHIAKRQRHS